MLLTRRCDGCGREFEATRRHARTCSPRCRKRAERARNDPAARRRKADRDRKRRERAAERADRNATLPAAPCWPSGLVEFAEALTVTQGDHEGEPLTLLPWERDYLEAVEAAGDGEIGLSVAAGAGKTTLVATIAAAAVAGPLAKRRAAAVVVAGSFAQACIAFDTARAFLQGTLAADPDRWRVLRSEQRALIQDRETGAELRAREANARTLHGLAPALVIGDEPAQWQPTQRDRIYSALRSRLGKIPGARLLAIGTRPEDPSHWFAGLLRRNGQTYAAPPDADPFDPAVWGLANPSLQHLPALLAVYQREAAEAAADPSLLPEFKALRLNMGTADTEVAVLVDVEAWQRCEVDILPERRGRAVWGVDLSGGDAMAAVAAYWPTSGRLEALAAFPELPDLRERGHRDGADYARMHADGDLLVMGRPHRPGGRLGGGGAGTLGAAIGHRGRPPPRAGATGRPGGGRLPTGRAGHDRHGVGARTPADPRLPARRGQRPRMGAAAPADTAGAGQCPHRL